MNKKNGWTKNWSGRGVAMMNHMETYGSKSPNLLPSKDASDRISGRIVKDMINTLLINKPTNNFYKSIFEQFHNQGSISIKQFECIKHDYTVLEALNVREEIRSVGNLNNTDANVDENKGV